MGIDSSWNSIPVLQRSLREFFDIEPALQVSAAEGIESFVAILGPIAQAPPLEPLPATGDCGVIPPLGQVVFHFLLPMSETQVGDFGAIPLATSSLDLSG